MKDGSGCNGGTRRGCGRRRCGTGRRDGWRATGSETWRRRSALEFLMASIDEGVAIQVALARVVSRYGREGVCGEGANGESECPAGAQSKAQSHAGDDQSSLEAVPPAFELGPYRGIEAPPRGLTAVSSRPQRRGRPDRSASTGSVFQKTAILLAGCAKRAPQIARVEPPPAVPEAPLHPQPRRRRIRLRRRPPH